MNIFVNWAMSISSDLRFAFVSTGNKQQWCQSLMVERFVNGLLVGEHRRNEAESTSFLDDINFHSDKLMHTNVWVGREIWQAQPLYVSFSCSFIHFFVLKWIQKHRRNSCQCHVGVFMVSKTTVRIYFHRPLNKLNIIDRQIVDHINWTLSAKQNKLDR